MSSQSFADLGVSEAVASALADRGITNPFAVQKLVIADVLDGHDVLAQSPTGSGKTLAFGVPMVDRIAAEARRPAALVLAPTRELADADRRRDARRAHGARPVRRRRLRRRRHPDAGQQGRQRPHRGRHPRPPGGSPPAPRPHARARAAARARRGRPHARHGLQARRRPHRRQDPPRTARRCSSPPRSRARSASSPAAYTRDASRHAHSPSRAQGRHQAPLRAPRRTTPR